LQALDPPSRRHRRAPATDGDEIPGRIIVAVIAATVIVLVFFAVDAPA
jgi:hypothetical protein